MFMLLCLVFSVTLFSIQWVVCRTVSKALAILGVVKLINLIVNTAVNQLECYVKSQFSFPLLVEKLHFFHLSFITQETLQQFIKIVVTVLCDIRARQSQFHGYKQQVWDICNTFLLCVALLIFKYWDYSKNQDQKMLYVMVLNSRWHMHTFKRQWWRKLSCLTGVAILILRSNNIVYCS